MSSKQNNVFQVWVVMKTGERLSSPIWTVAGHGNETIDRAIATYIDGAIESGFCLNASASSVEESRINLCDIEAFVFILMRYTDEDLGFYSRLTPPAHLLHPLFFVRHGLMPSTPIERRLVEYPFTRSAMAA